MTMQVVTGILAGGWEETPVNPLRADEVYVAAWNLAEEHFPLHRVPYEEFDDARKRIVSRQVRDLMRKVADEVTVIEQARTSLRLKEMALVRVREELAVAVASWPKDE